MKILHISEGSLPDWRIEKAALTAKKEGHDVLFAGTYSPTLENRVFDKIYDIKWDFRAKYGIPYYWGLLKKRIKKIIEISNPDLIHAHQIVPAKISSQLGLPYIFDDHEYSSNHARVIYEAFRLRKERYNIPITNFREKLRWNARVYVKKYNIKVWSKWEKEIVSSVPTITVSNAIASNHRSFYNNNKVFVVPNYPLKNEIPNISLKYNQNFTSVYIGTDGLQEYQYPNRNMEGFIDLFKNDIGKLNIIGWRNKNDFQNNNVNYKGFLSRNDFLNEMANCSIGIIPWKKHWSHKYLNPNKAYEYAYSGLLVLCISDLSEVINTLHGYCDTFNDYSELVTRLKYYQNNLDELYDKRLKLQKFARENLIWENYEKNILEAYKIL